VNPKATCHITWQARSMHAPRFGIQSK